MNDIVRTSTNDKRHPYARNDFKGTEEIQAIRKKMYQKSHPVKTVYDFRKEEDK